MNAESYIQEFKLLPHPEGGFYKETFRDKRGFYQEAEFKSYSTLIYYLLRTGEISKFHSIPSDEIWHFYDGSPLELHTISPDGKYDIQILGRELEFPNFQGFVPAGYLMAAKVQNPNSYSLIGCTVAPGFDFKELFFPSAKELKEMFPQHIEIIKTFL